MDSICSCGASVVDKTVERSGARRIAQDGRVCVLWTESDHDREQCNVRAWPVGAHHDRSYRSPDLGR